MTLPPSYPQPSAEWIAKTILGFAKKRYFIRTFDRDEPLFTCGLELSKLGKHVHVELMPSLALRVRDKSTGEILAQSMPADFDTLDVTAPAVEEMFRTWRAVRHPLEVATAAPPSQPQPCAEWLAEQILGFAKKRYFIRTFDRDEPLFTCGLVLPKLGKHVHVELMPSLALRVRDKSTGEILAQSMPGDFDALDVGAPIVEEMFRTWQAGRAAVAQRGSDTPPAET